MPITRWNVPRHELVGLEARVTNSSDLGLIGTCGKIVDETRDMLVIEQAGRPKIVPKANSVFIITLLSGEEVEVLGNSIFGRPEERVKRRR